jgi:hypothetical protein
MAVDAEKRHIKKYVTLRNMSSDIFSVYMRCFQEETVVNDDLIKVFFSI